MNTIKKVVIVLSVLCYIAIALYAVCAIPMLFGYTPLSVTDGHLSKDFPVGSIFYWHKADVSEMKSGLVAVYKDGGETKTGLIISAENEAVTLCKSVNYDNEGKIFPDDKVTISTASVKGINKGPNIPFIGYYLNYIQNHVAVIVVIGVILSLRILFIYIEPKKDKKKKESEDDSFEMSLGGLFNSNEQEAASNESKEEDIGDIFAQSVKSNEPEEVKQEVSFESVLEGNDNRVPSQFKDESEIDISSILSEHIKDEQDAEKRNEEIAEMQKLDEVKEMEEITNSSAKEADFPSGATEITDYINKLVFDSKDGSWYNAAQVDEALDMITAKVYDALNAANSSSASYSELQKIRDEKATLEKKFLEKDAALASAGDKLYSAEKKLLEYEKEIENYKVMEKKVARLVAALKAQKQNG